VVSDWLQAAAVLPPEKHLFFHPMEGRLGGSKEVLGILETGRNSVPSPESTHEPSVLYSTT